MTATEQRISKLLEMLVRGTNENLLHWQFTADEDTFRLSSPTANVRIARSEGFNREIMEAYFTRRLSVLNDRARLIEEWEPTTAAEQQKFDELYVNARRSASKTDDVLDKLMMELRASGVS